MELFFSLIAALVVSLISFVGVILFVRRVNSKSLIITALVSFAAGALLGEAFIHLIGEYVEINGYNIDLVAKIFLGILIMLVIEAYFHCSHDSEVELDHDEVVAKSNLIGDGLHNFLDGIAIASSFLVSPVVGIASTIAIAIHEIPQELADTAVLLHSGWKRNKVIKANFLTALTAIGGVLFVFLLGNIVEGIENFFIPLAAGQFIYIALSDLLPVIHKRRGIRKYLIEIATFILGFIIMYLITFFE